MSTIHQEVLTHPRIPGARVPGSTFVRGAGVAIVSALVAVWNALLVWQDRAIERANLASLHDETLKDMGISRADAAREASKPFWRA